MIARCVNKFIRFGVVCNSDGLHSHTAIRKPGEKAEIQIMVYFLTEQL